MKKVIVCLKPARNYSTSWRSFSTQDSVEVDLHGGSGSDGDVDGDTTSFCLALETQIPSSVEWTHYTILDNVDHHDGDLSDQNDLGQDPGVKYKRRRGRDEKDQPCCAHRCWGLVGITIFFNH